MTATQAKGTIARTPALVKGAVVQWYDEGIRTGFIHSVNLDEATAKVQPIGALGSPKPRLRSLKLDELVVWPNDRARPRGSGGA